MNKNIKKYNFKSGLPQEFEIVYIDQLYQDATEIITAIHRTEFYHIIWFQKGSPTHLVDFNQVEITPNTILFVNKDTVHRFDKKGDFDGKVILFTDAFFCKTESDIKYLRSHILFNDLFSVSQINLKDNSTLFTDLFKLMETELTGDKDIVQADILKNYLHNFLLIAERERRKQGFVEIKKGADFDYLMLFKDLLETKYRKIKQVSHYANQLDLTAKRLNQATSRILGKSPKKMIEERVMLEAKRRLAHTHYTVKEIGFDLGFDEPTNFTKFFRNHSNQTPIQFREQYILD